MSGHTGAPPKSYSRCAFLANPAAVRSRENSTGSQSVLTAENIASMKFGSNRQFFDSENSNTNKVSEHHKNNNMQPPRPVKILEPPPASQPVPVSSSSSSSSHQPLPKDDYIVSTLSSSHDNIHRQPERKYHMHATTTMPQTRTNDMEDGTCSADNEKKTRVDTKTMKKTSSSSRRRCEAAATATAKRKKRELSEEEGEEEEEEEDGEEADIEDVMRDDADGFEYTARLLEFKEEGTDIGDIDLASASTRMKKLHYHRLVQKVEARENVEATRDTIVSATEGIALAARLVGVTSSAAWADKVDKKLGEVRNLRSLRKLYNRSRGGRLSDPVYQIFISTLRELLPGFREIVTNLAPVVARKLVGSRGQMEFAAADMRVPSSNNNHTSHTSSSDDSRPRDMAESRVLSKKIDALTIAITSMVESQHRQYQESNEQQRRQRLITPDQSHTAIISSIDKLCAMMTTQQIQQQEIIKNNQLVSSQQQLFMSETREQIKSGQMHIHNQQQQQLSKNVHTGNELSPQFEVQTSEQNNQQHQQHCHQIQEQHNAQDIMVSNATIQRVGGPLSTLNTNSIIKNLEIAGPMVARLMNSDAREQARHSSSDALLETLINGSTQ